MRGRAFTIVHDALATPLYRVASVLVVTIMITNTIAIMMTVDEESAHRHERSHHLGEPCNQSTSQPR
jgi:hypothetical protein